MDTIKERVRKIIAEELSLNIEKITSQASITDELGADSLDGIQIIVAIEDDFEISLPDSKAIKMKTVDDIVNFLRDKI